MSLVEVTDPSIIEAFGTGKPMSLVPADDPEGVIAREFRKDTKGGPSLTPGGNIDLAKRPVVKNADGSISTERSMSFQDQDKLETLIPTVADDGSRILSNEEAIRQYRKTGQHLGKFKTVNETNAFADLLHREQDRRYNNHTVPAPKLQDRVTDASSQSALSALGQPPVDRGEFLNALQRSAGPQNLTLSGHTILALEEYAGDGTWNPAGEELIRYGEEASKNIAQPKVPSMTDIGSLGDVGDYLKYQAGSGLGSFLPQVAGGIALGTVGSRLGGKIGAAIGSVGGAFAASNALNIGSMRQTLIEEGVTDPKLRGKVAVRGGMVISALDTFVPGGLAAKLTGGARKELEKALIRRIMSGTVKGSLREGITEGTQQAIEQSLAKDAAGKPLTMDDFWKVADATVGGALVGGAATAATDAVSPPKPQPTRTGPPRADETVVNVDLAPPDQNRLKPIETGFNQPPQAGQPVIDALKKAGYVEPDIATMQPEHLRQALAEAVAQGAIPADAVTEQQLQTVQPQGVPPPVGQAPPAPPRIIPPVSAKPVRSQTRSPAVALDTLRKAGHTDAEIRSMSPDQIRSAVTEASPAKEEIPPPQVRDKAAAAAETLRKAGFTAKDIAGMDRDQVRKMVIDLEKAGPDAVVESPQQPVAGTSAEPRVLPPVPDYVKQNRKSAIETASHLGLTDEIRRRATKGETAKQISEALKGKLSVDDVRAVRESLGIEGGPLMAPGGATIPQEGSETIKSPAIRYKGKTYTALNHTDATLKVVEESGKSIDEVVSDPSFSSDAFQTSTGRVVDRKEAATIAEAQGQTTEPTEYLSAHKLKPQAQESAAVKPSAQTETEFGKQSRSEPFAPSVPKVRTASTASWVIREKATGKVVMETFDRKKVRALNTAKYEAVPIGEYLGGLNTKQTSDARTASGPEAGIQKVGATSRGGSIEAYERAVKELEKLNVAAGKSGDYNAYLREHESEFRGSLDKARRLAGWRWSKNFYAHGIEAAIERAVAEKPSAPAAPAEPPLPKPTKARKAPSLIPFLLSKGGVRDYKGELRATGVHPAALVRSKGLSLDYAREAAVEAGYLPRGADISDLLEAIGEESRGNKVRPLADQGEDLGSAAGAQAERDRYDEAELKIIDEYGIEIFEYLQEVDLKPSDWTSPVLERAKELIIKDNIKAERAFEIATAEDERAAGEEIETRIGLDRDDEVQRSAPSEAVGSVPEARQEGDRSERESAPLGSLPEPPVSRESRDETGAEGKPQTVLPGAERVSDKTLAQRRADAPLKPKAEQKPMESGLFGDDSKQTDLLDMPGVRKPQKPLASLGTPEQKKKSEAVATPFTKALSIAAQSFGYKIVNTGLPFGATDQWGKFHSFGTQLYDKLVPGSDIGKWIDKIKNADPATYEYIKEHSTGPWFHRVWFGHDPLANLGTIIDKFGVEALPEYFGQLLKDSLTTAGIPLPGVQWLVQGGLVGDRAATNWLSLNIGEALSGGLSVLATYRLYKQAKNGEQIHKGWAIAGILFKVVGGTLSSNPVVLLSAAADTAILVRAQIASIKAGMAEMEKPRGPKKPLASLASKQPIFYSALLRAVEGMKQEKASPNQWLGTIRNAPGVKAAEIEWLGLEDWIKQQASPVTKAQVLDFIRANQVQVSEVVKGAERPLFTVSSAGGPASQYRSPMQFATRAEAEAEMAEREAIGGYHSIAELPPEGSNTKFSTYTLPGGENYRELLLTLPVRTSAAESRLDAVNNRLDEITQMRASYHAEHPELVGEFDDLNAERRQLMASEYATPPFRSSHFDEPNVLAHVRFNERTDAEGKKVLFIEEIQSDWHQKGRKQGYKGEIDAATKAKIDALETKRRQAGLTSGREASQRYTELTAEIDRLRGRDAVPDAPFKTTWPELAFKRMVRWGAENGFDRVAWAPGEVQAERYDLSKHIQKISYDGNQLWAWKKDSGTPVINKSGVAEKDLPDIIGKEAAERLLAQPPNRGDGRQRPYRTLEGLELKVGGEGMRGFYDKILVDIANKIGKRFGAKVGRTRLTTQDQSIANDSPAHATALGVEPVPSLDVTDAMRSSVMEGQPLFDLRYDRQPPYAFAISAKQRNQVTREVLDLGERILGHRFGLHVVDRIPRDRGDSTWQGMYSPDERAVYVAIRVALDPVKVMGHEAIHALRDIGAFTRGEWAVLSRYAQKRITDDYIQGYREAYANYDLAPDQLNDLLLEEATAELFAEFVAEKREVPPGISRILRKLSEFLEAVRNMLKGHGFTSADQIFRDVYSGKVGKREEGTGPGRPYEVRAKETEQAEAASLASLAEDAPGLFDVVGSEKAKDELKKIASNLNLDRIAAAENIKQVLAQVSESAGHFIGERRGVVSHEETARLAAEIGMSPSDLLKRQTGQALNAHEIFAARVLLVKSAKRLAEMAAQAQRTKKMADLAEFQKAFTRHVAIQEQIAGMAAEAGRAMEQFKMMAGDTYYQAAKGVVEMARYKNKLRPFGSKKQFGADAVLDLARMVNELNDPQRIGQFTRDAYKITIWDKIRELWINALLSGPRTQAVNFLSNTLTALWQVPETAVASAIGKFHGGERVESSEAGERLFGLIEGTKDGLIAMRETWRTGEPSDTISKIETHRRKAIGGRTGEIVRMPGRALMATDELFKAVNYRAEINALALREGIKSGKRGKALAAHINILKAFPTTAMKNAAHQAALYNTFQNELGPIAQAAMRLRDKIPGGYVIVPFIRTVTNIMKYAVERTPLGLAMENIRDNLKGKNGNIARDTQMARIFLGSAIAATVASMVLGGLITGGEPDDPEERALWLEDNQPYSIKINGKWYSYQRFDPFAMIVGTTADFVSLMDVLSERQIDKMGTLIVTSLSGNVLDKTWMSGPSNFMKAIMWPERYGDSYIQRLGSSVVPVGVKQLAQTMDPVVHETDSVWEAIKAGIPVVSRSLLSKRDVFGEEITREGSWGPDILSPVFMKTPSEDPVVKALREVEYYPSKPGHRIGDQRLTPEQYDEYSETAGKLAKKRLDALVKSSGWKTRDRDNKIKVMRNIFDNAREEARHKMKSKYPELRPH